MIKLIALDMDGTLLNDKKELTQPQIEAIQQAVQKGIQIVLCTGRMLTGVKPFVQQLQLDKENEYVIVNNGCSTHQTSDWGLIDWAALTPEQIKQLADDTTNQPWQLSLFDEDHYYILDEEPNAFAKTDASHVFTQPVTLSLAEATQADRRFFQAMFVGRKTDIDQLENQSASRLSQQYNVVRSQDTLLEILPHGTSKASALRQLAKHLHIDSSEIMAVGDANNDIEMLKFAGLSVAMGNANDLVKFISTAITDTNNNDGVAKAIRQYAL